jgi:hypothetical protein
MARDFKKQVAEARTIQPRAAIPQVDPAAVKPPEPAEPQASLEEPIKPATAEPAKAETNKRPIYLSPVDTNEKGASQAFQMYPSRHTQLKDLAYIEHRNPWQIIEDALEEYVVRHYGKKYRRD